jgi:triacylglycerol lipase
MSPASMTRRHVLLGVAASGLVAACGTTTGDGPAASPPPPIVFVHGNGDSAALWLTTLWRFESNGWPRDRLHAIDFPYPLSRDDDTKAQDGRSSTADARAFLAAEIDRVLAATGARQVVLIANSRGGNAVRNVLANGDPGRGLTPAAARAKVSHAILCGTRTTASTPTRRATRTPNSTAPARS